MNRYFTRHANKTNDDKELTALYDAVFLPEEVGAMAQILFSHFPGMKEENWYIAEEKSASHMVSALTLIPWTWEMQGVRLKVAEMGLVGTLAEHRGKGLFKMLSREFDRTLIDSQYDLAVIQGIPGFYHKSGYHYALEMENHINIPLEKIVHNPDTGDYVFRLAKRKDIPFFMSGDIKYRSANLLSAFRSEDHWEYMLSHGLQTDYASEFWIMQRRGSTEWYYFRIVLKGFGTGLIVSEMSEDLPAKALHAALHFCRQKAEERKKTYIRFNMHNRSAAMEMLKSLGVSESKSYAWQVKIPDRAKFLLKMKPLLEERMSRSSFHGFSGIFRLNLYSSALDMIWKKGRLESVTNAGEGESHHTFCIGADLFPALVLGHRSWEELQHIRPDVAPELLYVLPTEAALTDVTGDLAGVMFPAEKSWIYGQY
jgi:predicted N-acetyltransferase YhbS